MSPWAPFWAYCLARAPGDSVSPLHPPWGPHGPPLRPETSSSLRPPKSSKALCCPFPFTPPPRPSPLSHPPVKRRGRSQGWELGGCVWGPCWELEEQTGPLRAHGPRDVGAAHEADAGAGLWSATAGQLGAGAGTALASLLPCCFRSDEVITSGPDDRARLEQL